jgi:uncharacterized protein YcbK (DUF882 family)
MIKKSSYIYYFIEKKIKSLTLKQAIIVCSLFLLMLILFSDNKYTIDKTKYNYLSQCNEKFDNNIKFSDKGQLYISALDQINYVVNNSLENNEEILNCYVYNLELEDKETNTEKIQVIHDYITLHMNYDRDSTPDDESKYPSQFVKDNKGDCEDFAIFSLTLLKKIDIDVNTYIIDADYIGKKKNIIGHIALAFNYEDLKKDLKKKEINKYFIESNKLELIFFNPPSNVEKYDFYKVAFDYTDHKIWSLKFDEAIESSFF